MDKEYIVKAGQVLITPPNVPHSFTALEDNAININFFSPARKDRIEGKDNYYEKK
ncbi:hypothetical protein P2W68_07710 [Chryseobacterium arthrosphaerae]|uniref:hypothetical protein n=1 Tax=Chryseobacterium arthrosphaerae TaxID=651561 RepID=UPI0023E16A95|nr:hypothetical protein [Chryseobacterium arthrosphaerae]WES99495.1 hypothetical protein P2W68_07710 [Chryseobacterium arthrosphaerae]